MKKVLCGLLSAVFLIGTYTLGHSAGASETESSELTSTSVPSVDCEASDTELVFIIDQSRSMHHLQKNIIRNLNRIIDEQKEDTKHGGAFVTTVVFNNRCVKVHDREEIQTVRRITRTDCLESSGTAMRDAIGSTINELSSKGEIAGHKVVVVIVTDGEDNRSTRYTQRGLYKLIREKKEEGWKFIFYGANIEVERIGSSIGADAGSFIPFSASDVGRYGMFENLSWRITLARTFKLLH